MILGDIPLIKLSPHAKYAMEDFGCRIRTGSSAHGSDGGIKCIRCVFEKEGHRKSIIYCIRFYYFEQYENYGL